MQVTLFLQPEQTLHFDDVAYLHQHLVANLPDEPAAHALRLPPEFAQHEDYVRSSSNNNSNSSSSSGGGGNSEANGSASAVDTCEEGKQTSAGSCEAVARDGGGRALLLIFVTSASHATAAADALARWARDGHGSCRREIELQVCSPSELSPSAEQAVSASLRSLPPSVVRSQGTPPLLRCADPRVGSVGGAADRTLEGEATAAHVADHGKDGGGSNVAAAAATLQHVGSALHRSPHRMLLACIDATDGHTMAAALAARITHAGVLNVCDVPQSIDDGLSPPETSAATRDVLHEMIGSVAGCSRP